MPFKTVFWASLASFLPQLGASWVSLGLNLEPLGRLLGSTWSLLGASWVQVGTSEAPLGLHLGALGALLGVSRAPKRLQKAPGGSQEAPERLLRSPQESPKRLGAQRGRREACELLPRASWKPNRSVEELYHLKRRSSKNFTLMIRATGSKSTYIHIYIYT